jgi:hypothetical protein
MPQWMWISIGRIIGGSGIRCRAFIESTGDNTPRWIGIYISDLPPMLVPHVELEFCHFLFLNAGMPPVLEDGNSVSCAA